MYSPKLRPDLIGRLHAVCQELGIPMTRFVHVAVFQALVRAERRLAEWFGRQYGDAGMASRVSVWGGVDRCVEGLSEVIEGGAEMLMLNPVFDHLEHLQALNAEVVPRLSLT